MADYIMNYLNIGSDSFEVADATARADTSELKQDLSDLTSSCYLKVIDIQKVDGKYIGTNGNIANYTGMCYAVIPVSVGDILVLTTNPSGTINAISYSATETLSAPLERVVLGTGNTIQTYTWNVDKTGYAVVSGATESVSVKISRKYLRNQTEYDIYIAGSNSTHTADADFVCTGENDDEIINKALAIPSVKSVYFYSDSIFSLSAPIILRSGQTIKSNGAVFTQPAMVTTELTSANTDVTSHLLRVSSVQGFKAGQYVYIQDDSGQNMSNIIASVYSAGNPSITFVNQIDYQWTPEYNTVIKTANPTFVLNNISNVEISGINIDWNVDENPIQTYNPYFLQECISVQYSDKISIHDCTIKNVGRRGICTTDSTNILINNCDISNCHEHAIDIFNGYATKGNTTTNPKLNHCVISNVIAHDCLMNGIQLHRGSGVVVDSCVCYGNSTAGIGMAEYAHDNIVSNCQIYDSTSFGILCRTGSFHNTIAGNNIHSVGNSGIGIRGSSAMRCNNNKISNNMIHDVSGNGILVEYSDYTFAESNSIFDCSSDMEIYKPIQCSLSTRSYLLNNAIKQSSSSTIYAIRCGGSGTNYNVVKGNIIENAGAPSTTGANDVVEGNVVF